MVGTITANISKSNGVNQMTRHKPIVAVGMIFGLKVDVFIEIFFVKY